MVPSPPARADYNYLLNYRAGKEASNISEANFGSAEALARAKREYAEYFQKQASRKPQSTPFGVSEASLVRTKDGVVDIELSQKMADSAVLPTQKAKTGQNRVLQQNQKALDALQQ